MQDERAAVFALSAVLVLAIIWVAGSRLTAFDAVADREHPDVPEGHLRRIHSLYQWNSSAPVNFTLRSNTSAWIKPRGAPAYYVETGPRGFRDLVPEREERLMLVLGDSVTFGVGVPSSATYPQVVDRRLENVSVLNTGRPTAGMPDYVELLRNGDLPRPDIVVVGMGTYDFISSMTSRRLHLNADLDNGTSAAQKRDRILEIIQRRYPFRERSDIIVRHAKRITEWARQRRVPVVFYAIHSARYDAVLEPRFRHVIIAPERYREDWNGYGNPNRYRISDRNAHPNAAGHRLLAERLLAYLREAGLVR